LELEPSWRRGLAYLYLQWQVGADGVQQQLGGFLSAHQNQLQVQVPSDQQAFGHQADPHHAAQSGGRSHGSRRPVGPRGGATNVRHKDADRLLLPVYQALEF